jgi:hypothetical protein
MKGKVVVAETTSIGSCSFQLFMLLVIVLLPLRVLTLDQQTPTGPTMTREKILILGCHQEHQA